MTFEELRAEVERLKAATNEYEAKLDMATAEVADLHARVQALMD